MWNGLEKRISRLEKRVAEGTEKNKVCNCRGETRYHSADCLDAILKGIPRVCPLHGFREQGGQLRYLPMCSSRSGCLRWCCHRWELSFFASAPEFRDRFSFLC